MEDDIFDDDDFTVWTTDKGRRIPVEQMNSDRLKSIIKMLMGLDKNNKWIAPLSIALDKKKKDIRFDPMYQNILRTVLSHGLDLQSAHFHAADVMEELYGTRDTV